MVDSAVMDGGELRLARGSENELQVDLYSLLISSIELNIGLDSKSAPCACICISDCSCDPSCYTQ